ncbi:hypothetical protein PHISCL_07900 [Aspergillus sclerotialis]|uniref:Clavaminate synthase-like protein n=1 Tax=Aspergillus sclerotialis TaxID=2070753 RepID=A0A3A2ZBW1_9EURO|nr:hypothetical protein PHISCL_07900 [Aspergillus sclerotialis]
MKTAQAITVSLQELIDGSITSETLTEAFGPSSLGIIIVKDLPPQFKDLRAKVLSNASYLAALPEDDLGMLTSFPPFFTLLVAETLTSAKAKYLIGWSCGKETLRSGHFDTLKGSYYVNCAFYQDPELQGAPPTPSSSGSGSQNGHPADLIEYTAPNIWPPADKLPSFRGSVEDLCRLIIDTAGLVARACDRFAEANIDGYEPGYLEKVVKGSFTTKARLLHYFPSPAAPAGDASGSAGGGEKEDDGQGEDDWCATHVDHSCLTGLTSAMFVDESSSLSPSPDSTLPELPRSPDPAAGLYIRSRTGEVVKVNIPKDCLAFQTGEALELITKGKFKAVPHFVRGARDTGGMKVARNTLAVFTQPNLGDMVDEGVSFGDFARRVIKRTY